ncbi:AhpC/TSA family protein [bacterium]|nr:AhpC/TSA family protein [bacterium]
MKKLFVWISLTLILGIIINVFWHKELKYTLPTPVPENFQEVPLGTCIDTDWNKGEENMTFLHFFNPDCPCSRFNLKHFHTLYRANKDKVKFYVIVPEGVSQKRTRRLVSDDIPILIDTDKKWRKACGIYATPQAVILDQGQIYYRGNYNKARFCTIPGSNYAEVSLKMLLQGEPAPQWEESATIAYGCQLPDSISVTPSFTFLPILTLD